MGIHWIFDLSAYPLSETVVHFKKDLEQATYGEIQSRNLA